MRQLSKHDDGRSSMMVIGGLGGERAHGRHLEKGRAWAYSCLQAPAHCFDKARYSRVARGPKAGSIHLPVSFCGDPLNFACHA